MHKYSINYSSLAKEVFARKLLTHFIAIIIYNQLLRPLIKDIVLKTPDKILKNLTRAAKSDNAHSISIISLLATFIAYQKRVTFCSGLMCNKI